MKPEGIRRREEALVEEAKLAVTPRPDGTRDEQALEDALAKLITVDVEKERRKKAKAIIDSLTDPDGTEKQDGQIKFEFMEAYPYKPNRLIRSNGLIVEQDKAPLAFKVDALKRSRSKVEEQTLWMNRLMQEVQEMAIWSQEQALAGRPVLDLTWGNCVREGGFWEKPGARARAA